MGFSGLPQNSLAFCGRVDGAGNRIRTYDPRITNALLYQLSYPGAGAANSIGCVWRRHPRGAPLNVVRGALAQLGVGPGPAPGPKLGGMPPALPRWEGHSVNAR